MDSVTQFVLGAALGQAVAGRRMGRVAALVGGVVATLPDLDVLVPFSDPVSAFTYHRSASHSLFLLALLSPFVAWIVCRVLPARCDDFRLWWWVSALVLLTHPLLDSLTVYGTQLLWPLSEHPFGLGSIFIIDPIYTVPLLISVVAAQFFKDVSRRSQWVRVALVVSSVYLGLGVATQSYVAQIAEGAIAKAGLNAQNALVQNTPFNILAWRIVVVEPHRYNVGYYSLLAPQDISFTAYPSAPRLLENIAESWPVARLTWFSKGLYSVDSRDGQVVIQDLRMGLEPDHYAFAFAVGRIRGDNVSPAPATRIEPAPYSSADWQALRHTIFGTTGAGRH